MKTPGSLKSGPVTALSPVIVNSSAADQMSITQTSTFLSEDVSLLVIYLFSDYIVIAT